MARAVGKYRGVFERFRNVVENGSKVREGWCARFVGLDGREHIERAGSKKKGAGLRTVQLPVGHRASPPRSVTHTWRQTICAKAVETLVTGSPARGRSKP